MKMDIRATLILAGFGLAVIAGIAAGIAGPGSRFEWWNFRTGFAIMKWAVLGSILAAALCAGGIFESVRAHTYSGLWLAAAGLFFGLCFAAVPLNMRRAAKRVPVINDITTDTKDPPAFSAILPLRAGATAPADYGGAEIAAQQLKAYPEVKPYVTDLPPGPLFEVALGTARWLGWDIVAANKSEGRIEAVDTTFWFGFKDDIVIRIKPEGNGSRLDIRSHSRVGKSDLGTNARRIMLFLEDLRK